MQIRRISQSAQLCCCHVNQFMTKLIVFKKIQPADHTNIKICIVIYSLLCYDECEIFIYLFIPSIFSQVD